MPTTRPSPDSEVELNAHHRIDTCLREIGALLDAVELMGHDEWHALHERYEALGPAKARKLGKTLSFDWMHLTSWPEITTIPTETALRDAMRSHWPRLGDAIQKARIQFIVDPGIDGMLNRATDTLVSTVWFRRYLEGSHEGRRALATVAALFDGLLPDPKDAEKVRARESAVSRAPTEQAVTAPRRASARPDRHEGERMPKMDSAPWRLRTFEEALALRTSKISHPVSPAYSVILVISERIGSRRGQRLSHGEQMFVTLFDELNAEWENGGLEQYLTNSSGERAEYARAYLAEVGAWETLALLDEAAWRFYGGSIPRSESARNTRLEKVSRRATTPAAFSTTPTGGGARCRRRCTIAWSTMQRSTRPTSLAPRRASLRVARRSNATTGHGDGSRCPRRSRRARPHVSRGAASRHLTSAATLVTPEHPMVRSPARAAGLPEGAPRSMRRS